MLRGGTVVACDSARTVRRADVLIEGDRIAKVGRVSASGATVVDARGRIIMPGFVMTHLHLCQALMRGMADDMPLLEWLKRRVWPLEAAHDERSIRASAEVGLSELLSAGVTSILDLGTVHHHDVVFDACRRSGMRTFGGKTLMDTGSGVPRRLRESTKRGLESADELARSVEDDPLINYVWIPRFILSCSEGLVRGAAARSLERGELMHTHAAEHPGERQAVREVHGADDVVVLRRWGMKGPTCSFAHGVQLSRTQMTRLAADGTSIAHCPSANLKLGSGIAKIAELRQRGVNVGIGPDGAPCNNRLDPWTEMRSAALLSSALTKPGVLQAADVLEMATLDGARLLGQEANLGSVEVGKFADLVVVRTDGVHQAPATNPIGTLVYATAATDVERVYVNGRQVATNGELAAWDVAEVSRRAAREALKLARRARIR